MNNYIKIAAFSIALSACHSSDNELANLTIAPKKIQRRLLQAIA